MTYLNKSTKSMNKKIEAKKAERDGNHELAAKLRSESKELNRQYKEEFAAKEKQRKADDAKFLKEIEELSTPLNIEEWDGNNPLSDDSFFDCDDDLQRQQNDLLQQMQEENLRRQEQQANDDLVVVVFGIGDTFF